MIEDAGQEYGIDFSEPAAGLFSEVTSDVTTIERVPDALLAHDARVHGGTLGPASTPAALLLVAHRLFLDPRQHAVEGHEVGGQRLVERVLLGLQFGRQLVEDRSDVAGGPAFAGDRHPQQ